MGCWRSLSVNLWVNGHLLLTEVLINTFFYNRCTTRLASPFTYVKLFIYFQDRDALSLKLEDTENWLYEDGEDQPKQVYIDKLAELKVIIAVVIAVFSTDWLTLWFL